MATNLSDVLEMFPRQEKNLSYGTAGFRENISLPLPSVFVKMGVLVSDRNYSKQKPLSCNDSVAMTYNIYALFTAGSDAQSDCAVKMHRRYGDSFP
jgi:hypothetical protein